MATVEDVVVVIDDDTHKVVKRHPGCFTEYQTEWMGIWWNENLFDKI
jgi:hypothetical protein